jgi:peroxiredoxin Q/BCP
MNTKDFTLPDQNGKLHSLSMDKGKWIVLYFYPRDDTPGCTKEACSFRDISADFAENNAVILGISKDSVASHKKFAQKYHLNFPILSDESLGVIKAYDAWGEKKFLGKTFDGILRKSYLINPEGKIVKEYPKVNVLVHAGEILNDIKEMSV